MLEILNPALLGGLVSVAAPIIVHIAHRRKVKSVDWGAMRFLFAMFAKNRRRLLIEQWLLLAVRMLILACLGLALLRPAWRPSEHAAGAIVRRGRTAAVLLIDDSVSTAAGRPESAFESMKELAIAYIESLRKADEISIIRLSEVGAPASDPIFDMEAAKEIVSSAEPASVASDVPALIEAGLAQFGRHLNPNGELVLVTDGRSEGWRLETERARWAEIRKRLADAAAPAKGPRKRPRLIILSPKQDARVDNLAVTDLDLDRALVAAGRTVKARVTVEHRGSRFPEGALLRMQIDGRTVAEQPLDREKGLSKAYMFDLTFDEPGSHVVCAAVEGARDSLPVDDSRWLSVPVSERMPVLLVEGTRGAGLDGSLGLAAAALDPKGDGRGLFKVDRATVADLGRMRLEDYRAVVLGDIEALDAGSVAAIERYVVAGGGVVVGTGPKTDMELVNRFWARGGDGFLPAPLGELVTPEKPARPATANIGHTALRAFKGGAAEAWKTGDIRSYYKLDTEAVDPGELGFLVVLDTGDPLVVERRRGLGRVTLVTTSLDLSWTDLPVQPAYVPLVRGIVGSLGSTVLPPRNLLPGDRITHAQSTSAGGLTGEAPDGSAFELHAGSWEGRLAYTSDPLRDTGAYRVRAANSQEPTFYAVSPHPDESRLELLDEKTRSGVVEGLAAFVLEDVQGLRSVLDPEKARPAELWRTLLALAVVFLFAETMLTRRQSQAESAAPLARDDRHSISQRLTRVSGGRL
jgi:hypothetical protein